jgi:hypothetical protein
MDELVRSVGTDALGDDSHGDGDNGVAKDMPWKLYDTLEWDWCHSGRHSSD